jgi:hypothetical protein
VTFALVYMVFGGERRSTPAATVPEGE